MRIISIVVLVVTACALALTQVKTKDANQKTQVTRETTSMRKQAKATFGLKSWDEKTYNEIEGAPKLTRVSATKSYQGDIEGEGKLEYLMMYRTAGSIYDKTVLPRVHLRRAGYPKEIARSIVFLCSDEASYITGTTLTPDGGFTLTM